MQLQYIYNNMNCCFYHTFNNSQTFTGNFPKDVLMPHVTPSLKDNITLQFQCDEPGMQARNAFYDTIWYVDGMMLDNAGTTGMSLAHINNGEANLQEHNLRDRKIKMGFQVLFFDNV